MDIVEETKQKFSLAWKDRLESSDLPCLDFLNDDDQAFGQFRHSIAVINDCLASIRVEVFIVSFLRKHVFSDGKCASDLKLAFNVGEIIAELELTFPGQTHIDSSGNAGHISKTFSADSEASLDNYNEENMHRLFDKPTTAVKEERDFHGVESYEKVTSLEHEQVPSGEGLDSKQDDESLSKIEVEFNIPPSSREPSNAERPTHTENDEKITIFTPIPDIHIENKTTEGKNESSRNESPTNLTHTSPEKRSFSVPTHNTLTQKDEEVHSSGNELDDDPFSSDSCSNSPEPVNQNIFLQDDGPDSSEILKIMPFSSRTPSFSVETTSEAMPHFGNAEHIYEDIEKYSMVGGKRRLSQSEVTLRKTFSEGGLRKSRDANEEVFLAKDYSSPEGRDNLYA